MDLRLDLRVVATKGKNSNVYVDKPHPSVHADAAARKAAVETVLLSPTTPVVGDVADSGVTPLPAVYGQRAATQALLSRRQHGCCESCHRLQQEQDVGSSGYADNVRCCKRSRKLSLNPLYELEARLLASVSTTFTSYSYVFGYFYS